MNEYDLSQLSYEEAVELHGQPLANPRQNDIVLIPFAQRTTDADPGSGKTVVYVIAACVIEISNDFKSVKIRKIREYHADGGTGPASGDELFDASHFSKSITERIREWKDSVDLF